MHGVDRYGAMAYGQCHDSGRRDILMILNSRSVTAVRGWQSHRLPRGLGTVAMHACAWAFDL
jgi:hypothetical protein